jgi:hypothetical protein
MGEYFCAFCSFPSSAWECAGNSASRKTGSRASKTGVPKQSFTAIKLSRVNRKGLRRSPDEACGVRDDRSHYRQARKRRHTGMDAGIQARDGNLPLARQLDLNPDLSHRLPSLDAGFRHPCRNDGISVSGMPPEVV